MHYCPRPAFPAIYSSTAVIGVPTSPIISCTFYVKLMLSYFSEKFSENRITSLDICYISVKFGQIHVRLISSLLLAYSVELSLDYA